MTHRADRANVEAFRTAVAQHLGLGFDDAKLDYLGDVLEQRLEATSSARADVYLDRLKAASTRREELRALGEVLTVGETFFFRNADHFRALTEHVLPERVRARGNDRRLRIVSAGCASGEEAYTLAILLREALPDFAAWDVRIRAFDINPVALARAAKARYPAWSLRATSDEARARYFVADGREFVVDPTFRRMVTFEERNLAEDDPAFWRSLDCDAIFCRNVLMYFTPTVMQQVIHRISEGLAPGGYLFLGHAETLRGLTNAYHLCHTHETFYYCKRDASDVFEEPQLREAAQYSVPPIIEEESWVDVIQRASDRITDLADGRTRAATPPVEATRAAPTWDLSPVHAVMREERIGDALEMLSRLPSDALVDPDTQLLHAVLLTHTGRLAESEEICRQLLARDELNAGAHYLMALCREHDSDADGAVEHDRAAVYLDAGFAMPHLHLGLLARRAGNAELAQRELIQARTLLEREDTSRLLLFGGGFSREMLAELCRRELRAAGGDA